jgi:hypothetical protein
VRGEQVVERLDELDFSHPSLDGEDEAARKRVVGDALKDALKNARSRQQRVLGTDTVVRVSPGVYSLRSKQPGDAAAATTALPPPTPSTPAAKPVRFPSLLSPQGTGTCLYLRLLTEQSKICHGTSRALLPAMLNPPLSPCGVARVRRRPSAVALRAQAMI